MAVLPQEFFDHMRASAREQLMAWRSLLDNWVESIDQREQRARDHREAAQGPEPEGAPGATSGQ